MKKMLMLFSLLIFTGYMIVSFTKQEISAAFQKVSKALPAIVEGQAMVSMGTFGLVLAGETDVITKILFRHEEPYWNGLSLEHAGNEIAALSHFSKFPLKDIDTPVLLDEPKELDHAEYSAYYQMTRLRGASMSWHPENNSQREKARLWHDGLRAGAALARFHRAAKDIPASVFTPANPIKHGHIHQIESLPQSINDALARADSYLQERKPMGIIHGDFHGGNIMVSDRRVTGLIDFGFTGYANLYYDFIKAKPYFMPALVEGYERETGAPVDRHLIAATMLGRFVSRLSKLENDKPTEGLDNANPERKKIIGTIIGCLEDMGPMSGVSF